MAKIYKKMKGWKVAYQYSDVMEKCSIGTPANINCVEYPANKKVKPKLKNSKLFFFKNKKNAINFLERYLDDGVIVPCVAENVEKIDYVAMSSYDYPYFWKNYYSVDIKGLSGMLSLQDAPEGSYCAESITCLD